MHSAREKVKKGRQIAIIGFGREGQSLLKFLSTNEEYRDDEIWILDRNAEIGKTKQAKNIHWQLGENYLENLERFSIIFRSPGIPYQTKEIQTALRAGATISSSTKIFFSKFAYLKKPRLIGITGTKGKGTTATLLAHILEKTGFNVVLAGNIGKPMLDVMEDAKRADFVILELSSFQLQDLDMSPEIAVVLDVFPDHLDAHRTIKEYRNAKMNIVRNQTKGNIVFYFSNNEWSKAISIKSKGEKNPVTPTHEGVKKNFDIASKVALHLGCPPAIINDAILSFKGLPHRLEQIPSIEKVDFYNDSAATNPEATSAAIRSFNTPFVLIAGGKDKNLDYAPLAHALQTSKVTSVILIGENKGKIEKMLPKKISRKYASNLDEAVRSAFEEAKMSATEKHNGIVLFSPGAASFDMFKNYEDRGEQFKNAVRALGRVQRSN